MVNPLNAANERCEHCLGLGSLTLGRNSHFYDFAWFTKDLRAIMGDCCCNSRTVAQTRGGCGPNYIGYSAMFSTAMPKVSKSLLITSGSVVPNYIHGPPPTHLQLKTSKLLAQFGKTRFKL